MMKEKEQRLVFDEMKEIYYLVRREIKEMGYSCTFLNYEGESILSIDSRESLYRSIRFKYNIRDIERKKEVEVSIVTRVELTYDRLTKKINNKNKREFLSGFVRLVFSYIL